MCLASVYSENNGEKKLLMAKVAKLEPENGAVVCRDFLGRTLRVNGRIAHIDLENNVIICHLEDE